MKTLQKLLVLAFGPVLLAVACIFFAAFQRTERAVREQLDQLAYEKLASEVRHIHDVFHQTTSSLRLLGLTPLVQSGDLEVIKRLLPEWAANMPYPLEGLYYNTASGSVYGSDGSAFDVSDRYYFPMIQRGETVVTKVISSRSTGQQVVLVLVPVFSTNTGERIGAMGATILVEKLARHVAQINPGFNGYAILTDEDDSPLFSRTGQASPQRLDDISAVVTSFSNDPGGKTRPRLSGGPATAYFQPIPNARWRLAFVYHDKDLFATRRNVRNFALTMLAVSIPFILLAVFRVKKDITEPMLALSASEERWRSLVAHAPFFIQTIDSQGKILFINQVVPGLDHDKVIGSSIYEYGNPAGNATMRQAVEAVFTTGKPQTYELEGTGPHGAKAHYTCTMGAIHEGGRISQAVIIALDITGLKQAEEDLRLHSLVLENMAEGVGLCDEAGRIIYSNPAEERMFGAEPGGLLGQYISSLGAYSDEENTRSMRDITDELTRSGRCTREMLNLRKDGTTFYSLVSLSRLHLAGKQHTVWVREDITERRQLEQQLLQAQKMESIGQLAGGVAHDFNNILTVIQGHAGVLQLFGGLHAEAAEAATEIAKASDRAANLVRQLLAFSRQQFMQPKELDLAATFSEMAKMLQRLLGEHIQLQFEAAARLPGIKADPGMMQQIILNLAVNARDAMPEGGVLTIRLDSEHRSRSTHLQTQITSGTYVCLHVSDTGCGIPPENLPRIFDPFFTTKEVGKGTGLGLATVYGIVKQHQGWVEVESQKGRGTQFRVYLPALSQPAPLPEPLPDQVNAQGGTETILIVEDEAPLRSLVKSILVRLGYEVIEARSGQEALAQWKKRKQDISLVLTDLVMPEGMSGIDLIKLLIEDTPNLKVLYTSGYSSEMVTRHGHLARCSEFLAKPYSPSQLAEAVRRMLDKTST